MNSFLDLHTSTDYKNTNRPYFTGTWEYTIVTSDYLIPFQFESQLKYPTSDIIISTVDLDGVTTDISSKFHDTTNKIASWTRTGPVSSTFSGATITAMNLNSGSYITSNEFSMTAGESLRLDLDKSNFSDSGSATFVLLKDGVTVLSITGDWSNSNDNYYFDIDITGADYAIRIIAGGGSLTASGATPTAVVSRIHLNADNYYWYDGGQLFSAIADSIYTLLINDQGTLYYTDYLDACGFTETLKYLISSSFDYGKIKYNTGYQQWIYKNASVRRAPRAEIEETITQRNGKNIIEKSIAAVRYVIRAKVTESEFEAFIHSMGATVTVTDYTGKSYTAVNIEITDPTWYRGNGIMELSFVDENNINVWTRNNSSL